jgi:bacterioferritin (cytochrome b1)
MAAAAPAHVIDALNGLLEAEMNSVFRSINEGSPYLSKATAEVRRPMAECGKLSRQHAQQLANLIDALGGVPTPRQLPRTEDQYLAYLSLKFLLPKLVMEKELILRRYENAKRAIGPSFPQVQAELDRIMSEQRQYLDQLKKAAHDATGGRYSGNGDPSKPVAPSPKNSDAAPAADD